MGTFTGATAGLVLNSHSSSAAFFASTPGPIRSGVSIGAVVWMTSWAMRFSCVAVGSVRLHVAGVVKGRSILKVLKMVVFGIPVEMPGDVGFLLRSDKRSQYDLVNVSVNLGAVFAQGHNKMFLDNRGLEYSLCDSVRATPSSGYGSCQRFDPPVVGHFVQPVVPGNGSPLFGIISHVGSYLAGLILGAFTAPARFYFTKVVACLA